MAEPYYMFPSQKDCCALCTQKLNLVGDVWKHPALPWVFCSRECCRTYFGKDSSVEEARS